MISTGTSAISWKTLTKPCKMAGSRFIIRVSHVLKHENMPHLKPLPDGWTPSGASFHRMIFIPVLSRYHLLHRIDLYMFEQVCRE